VHGERRDVLASLAQRRDLNREDLQAVVEVLAHGTSVSGSLKERVEQVERIILLEVLREHDNNKTSTAKTLGITREGLHKKLKQLGIA